MRLTGRVLDSFGNPFAEARVLVSDGQEVVASPEVEGDRLEFTCTLPAGHPYWLLVDPASLPAGWSPPAQSDSYFHTEEERRKDPFRHFASIRVPSCAENDIRQDLQVSLPAAARGRILDPSGQGVAGILVRLQGIAEPVQGSRNTTLSDALGRFHFPAIYPGRYRLVISFDAAMAKDGEAWPLPIPPEAELHVGQIHTFPDLVLDGGPGRIEGRILNQDGEPFEGLRIRCLADLPVAPGSTRHGWSSTLAFSTTDPKGRFLLEGLPLIPVELSLTSDFRPGQAQGEGHPAIWVPNLPVDLASEGGHVDVGDLVVEESRPFLLHGQLVYDSTWFAQEGLAQGEIQLRLEPVEGESLPEGVHRNPFRSQVLKVDPESGAFRYRVETPMPRLRLTVRLPGYGERSFMIQPEPYQEAYRQVHIPADLLR